MSKYKPTTNLVGEIVRFKPDTLALPRFLVEFKQYTPETLLIIRAHWREDGKSRVTLEVAGVGTLIDNMWLEWLVVVKQ